VVIPPSAAVTATAEALAAKRAKEGLTLENASTPNALRLLSKEKTLRALTDPNTVIKGVKTWAGDPMLKV
jgi:hypothetical protein